MAHSHAGVHHHPLQGHIRKFGWRTGLFRQKEISGNTISEIFDFNRWLEAHQKTLIEYRKVAKEMAFVRDRYSKYYSISVSM
jgi:hypothetical protein